MTRKRKILVAVLLIAVGAWAIDRLFLAAPATAPADAKAAAATPAPSTPTPKSTASAIATRPAAPPPTTRPPGPTIAQRLASLRRAENLDAAAATDAFSPPDAWFSNADRSSAAEPVDAPAAVAAPDNLHVTGIMKSDGSAMAIVNERIVREGDSLGRYRVLAITDQAVIVESEGHRWKLRLRLPTAPRAFLP